MKMRNLLSLVACLLIFNIGYAQQKVEYTDFLIVENPKKKYEGIYKNGKPFSGYFKTEEGIDDVPFIDYYENGEQKFRYHFDHRKKETIAERIFYDTKTEYENGKIKNGIEIKEIGYSFMIADYKDFKRTNIYLDIAGIHYFNIVWFEIKANSLAIKEFVSPEYRLEIKKEKNQPYEIIVYHKDKIFYQNKSKKAQEVNEASPNSITYYYKDNKTNQLQKKSYKIEEPNKEDEEKIRELFENAKILGRIFYSFSAKEEDSVEDIADRIYLNAQELNFSRTSSFEKLFVEKNPEEEVISHLIYNEKGYIEYGGRVTPNSNGTYKLETFGKEKKEYPEVSLEEIKKIIDKGIVVG